MVQSTIREVTEMNNQEIERLQAKTPEKRFLQVLEGEFHQPPRVARALLEEAQTCLLGQAQSLRPGQVRVILVRREAGHGRSLRETATTEVVWTVDAGLEDRQVLQRHGRIALRRVRIQRLLDEALAQSAAATQEDLAHVLHVSVRTIKRDCVDLQSQGIYVPTRGNLHGIGRGQTHKAQIVRRWLEGETYDQIALHTHHSLTSIQRYIQTFVRVIHLHRQGFSESQIAMLLEISQALVQEYLAVYRQNDAPECRERLDTQLQRLSKGMASQHPKKGGQ
jgi:predicted ArsR family transcriptional regulator